MSKEKYHNLLRTIKFISVKSQCYELAAGFRDIEYMYFSESYEFNKQEFFNDINYLIAKCSHDYGYIKSAKSQIYNIIRKIKIENILIILDEK